MEKLLAKNTDCIITINEEDYQLAKKKFSKNTVVEKISGIGVNLEKFSALTEKEKLELKKQFGYENKFVLIYAAEFISRKNHRFIIRATKELADECSNFKIIFCGKGKLLEECKLYAKKLGVEKHIDFLGFRKDMPDLYRMSDVLISSSFQEGMAINVIEGFASGLPAIVSDIRGHNDVVINGENGFLFSNKNEQEFIKNILYMKSNFNEYKKMSQNALRDSQKYSIEVSLSEMNSIYVKFGV